jgi:hypothetical protein
MNDAPLWFVLAGASGDGRRDDGLVGLGKTLEGESHA